MKKIIIPPPPAGFRTWNMVYKAIIFQNPILPDKALETEILVVLEGTTTVLTINQIRSYAFGEIIEIMPDKDYLIAIKRAVEYYEASYGFNQTQISNILENKFITKLIDFY